MSDKKSPKKYLSFSETVARFADRTAVNGPAYISTSRHAVSKAIWTVFFLVAIGMTIYMVTMNFKRYFSWEVKSTISLGYSQLQFPTVTICNSNQVRLSELWRAGPSMKEFTDDLNPGAFARTRGPEGSTTAPVRKKRFINNKQKDKSANWSFVPNDYFDYENGDDPELSGDTAAQFEVERDFGYIFNQLSRETRVLMGHQLEDMLLYCSFEGRECSADNFTLLQTSDNGNCYRFNHGLEGQTYTTRRTGQTYGLQLIMYLDVNEYIPGLTLGYGMRLSLSPPKTFPPISSEGLLISAGEESSIGIQLLNISRLGGYYGNCSSDTGDSFLNQAGLTYTKVACLETCEARQVYEQCNCCQLGSDDKYPNSILENTRKCNSSDVACINKIKKKLVSNGIGDSCDCPTACREYAYQPTISSRIWPEEAYMNSLVDAVCTHAPEVTCNSLIDMTETRKRRNFLKVNVFYRDLNYQTISEAADYPQSSFFSDLGGSIGLWVGFSVLGLLEVFQLVLELCYGCFTRLKRKGEISASRDRGKTEENQDGKLPLATTPIREHGFPDNVYSTNQKM